MGIEIEAKMRLDDMDRLIARLSEVGATRGRDMVELNRYFDTPDGSLRSSDRGLRLRLVREFHDSQSTAIVTYKGPRAEGALKRRTEIEVVVDDADAAAKLLGLLGFVSIRSFEKRRRQWALHRCEVDIDTLPHLGHFVEIEGPSDEAVMSVRQVLGLGSTPLITRSYASMLETYITQQKMTIEHLCLDDQHTSDP